MGFLLDTHVLIWWLDDSRRLGKLARRSIVNPDAEVYISAASIWEMSIKSAIGRLKLKLDPEQSIPDLFARGFEALPVHFRHAFEVRRLPPHHADPFDRMLVAQARCEGLTLLTADPAFGAYAVPIMDASA